MEPLSETKPLARNTTREIRSRIERGGERIWRHKDFPNLPASAVAQALSRLARKGELERVSKGIYYRPRKTAFGPSRPNPAKLRKLAGGKRKLFPAGLSAANHLGFTTQNPKQRELATAASSVPQTLLGPDTKVHTRRPGAWRALSETEAALLDFLRGRGETSEFSPEETITRLLDLLEEENRFEKLLKAADSEPPRVRALLGALGEELGKDSDELGALKQSLNSLSRFDFGKLSGLKHAQEWQAKERRTRETVSAS